MHFFKVWELARNVKKMSKSIHQRLRHHDFFFPSQVSEVQNPTIPITQLSKIFQKAFPAGLIPSSSATLMSSSCIYRLSSNESSFNVDPVRCHFCSCGDKF